MGIAAFCNIPVILATLCYNRVPVEVPGTQTTQTTQIIQTISNDFRWHSDLNREKGFTNFALPLGYATTILFMKDENNLIILFIIPFLQIPKSWDGIHIIFSYSIDELNK